MQVSSPCPALRSCAFGAALFFQYACGNAATFVWNNTTANWNDPVAWSGGVAPSGSDPTDILMFGGNTAAPYIAANNLPAIPALINQFVFNAVGDAGSANAHTIAGASIALGGASPQIVQNGLGAIAINAPIVLRAPLKLGGDGGTLTFNQPLSGPFDISKEGSSTFRFGTLGLAASNRWSGRMTIHGGSIRLDESTASVAALRANPVTLTSATALVTTPWELRLGTLSGAMGLVESRVPGPNLDNQDIVVYTVDDGTFGGTLRLAPPTGSGRNTGTLIIRGAAKQTLTGMFVSPDSAPQANALQIEKDIVVGHGATLSLSGNASLSQQTAAGAIVMSGGTFEIDNQTINNPNRLRDGDSGSTGLDSAGGGLFQLIGHATGTTELMSRLQLGSPTNARGGALTLRVIHNAGASAATQLVLQSLSRDGFSPTFSTVNFDATDGAAAEIPLGQTGAAPRIMFAAPPLQANGLLRNTRNFNVETVGWATVNGSAFATYGPNGIAPVALAAAPPGNTPGDPNANIEILGNFVATNAAGYSVNSLRIEPAGTAQRLEFNGTGNLRTNALLLAGARDYSIVGNGAAGWSGAGPETSAAAARYAHVESAILTIGLALNTTFLPLVKSGEGTLALTNPANANSFSPTILNEGALRANTLTLPIGELRFRGGVLEITGGGVFARNVGYGAANVNWIGINEFNNPVDEDAGSGGFAAVGADATIDLSAPDPTVLRWESHGFLESGHALIFGSRHADHAVIWSDPLGLSSIASPKYDAREIRVVDNPGSSADRARIIAPVGGSVQSDLLKTGAGLLELTAANSYLGATIVREGTLLVNGTGSIAQSFLTEVHSGATLGGNGTIGAVRVRPGGRLAPGSNISNTGVLMTGDVILDGPGAQVSVEIGGATAGALFDQIVVTGAIRLDGGDLAGSLLNGFNPAPNDLFFLMLNDGTDAVSGTFAQGSLVTISNAPFEIFYAGNSATNSATGGNDVGVRFIPEPASALLLSVGLLAGLASCRRR